jgi:hypothetical protein
MSWDEWRNMGETMGGVAVMGGPATALLAGVHAPVTPSPEAAGTGHGAMRHEAGAMSMGAMADTAEAAAPAHMRRMMDLHMRMMADTIIRQRVMADTALRRLIHEMMAEMPAEHGEHMRGMTGGDRKGEPKDSATQREHEMPHP